jgi:hypothetical protein
MVEVTAMRRREFIAGLGSAVAWSEALVAQVPTSRPLIAYLGVASREASAPMVSAFLEGLRELGYRDGHDFEIAYRFAGHRTGFAPIDAGPSVGGLGSARARTLSSILMRAITPPSRYRVLNPVAPQRPGPF